MDAKVQQIIAQVSPLLMRYGVKSLTMDDIAKHLGISKKTLYQIVSDKADLVEKAMMLYMQFEMAAMEAINEKSKNAIEELIEISGHMNQHLTQMHPSILFDLEKYYPASFRRFEEYKSDCVLAHVQQNLQDGIDQGLYRENLNIPIVARLYVARIDSLFDPKVFPAGEFNLQEVFLEHIRYHIRGVANETGVAYLKERFKQPDKDTPIF
ncbi:MAG: AcrR family transcriptional regulator [Bacteroidia bacterium]|jgi:AcrR family transcriptional regulator